MGTEAFALRSGKTIRLPASQLVPGDIVLLKSGDKVPADVRIISSKELRIDESALTGESLPVEKSPSSLPVDTVLAERVCMAYASSLVSFGQGRAIVVATGNKKHRLHGKSRSSAICCSWPSSAWLARLSPWG
jgi:P-type E1-E2 ATPase